jgi:hypothetical protein
MSISRDYVGQLRQLARATGAANRIIVIDNPYDLFADARASLMSAADVFVIPASASRRPRRWSCTKPGRIPCR